MSMNRIPINVALVALLSVALTSCRKAEAPVPEFASPLTLEPGVFKTNDVVRFYKELPPDAALVQVGSRTLTHADFQRLVDEKLAPYQKPGPRQKPTENERRERSACDYVFANFMARAAMMVEAEARGITPTAADMADAEKYLDTLCRRLRVTRDAFAIRFASGQEAVARRVREEATLKALLRDEFDDALEVSDAQAEAFQAELLRLAAETDATNHVFVARLETLRAHLLSDEITATNNCQSVTNGLPEGVLFTDEESYSGFEINLQQQHMALDKLTPGEWSEVVPLEDSFDLYGLRAITRDDDPGQTEYTFMTFSIQREDAWEIPEINTLKRDIAKGLRRERQVPWVRDLIRKAGLVYPNGIHLFADPSQPVAARRNPIMRQIQQLRKDAATAEE